VRKKKKRENSSTFLVALWRGKCADMAKLPLYISFLLALIKFAACEILTIDEIYSKADYIDEDLVFEQPRIAAGVDAKPLENLDYARLAIVFQNYFRTCGGSLFSGIYVLTTASCVFK
jgi:hypothetical protein